MLAEQGEPDWSDHPQTGSWASWPQAHNYPVTEKTNLLRVVSVEGWEILGKEVAQLRRGKGLQ